MRDRVGAGALALTFDDGPDPVWTALLLAELNARRAKATFFVDAPRALAHPGLIEAMGVAGHEVAFHCIEHRRHSERSEAELTAEVEVGIEALESIGVRPRAWRAPWGIVTAATRRVAVAHELDLWGWNVDTHDWRGDSREEMLAAIAAGGGLPEGAVVLMHDGIGPGARRSGCAQTVELAAALLDRSRPEGLRAATVSEFRRERLR